MKDPIIFKRLKDGDIVVLYDDVDNMYWWLLRSVPAIKYLGFSKFTFPTWWRTLNTADEFTYTDQYDYLQYEYDVLGNIEQEQVGDNLVVITNEYYESETEHSINNLVRRYKSNEDTLVVITNAKQFKPRGGVRPLYQEPFSEFIGSYTTLYNSWESVYEQAGFRLPLIDTKNLFLQDNAIVYEIVTGESLETTRELFEVLPDKPYLPLYDVFEDIFAREDEFGAVPLKESEVTGLDRWLRRRIEWERGTASEVAQSLNRHVARSGRTFDPSYAHDSPEMQNARKAAKNMTNETSIHKRYSSWLQRGHL